MHFEPKQVFGDTTFFRATWKRFASKIPPVRAFYRKDTDIDGISLSVEAYQCFAREIEAILKITPHAIDIEQSKNLSLGLSLAIIQDREDHAFIDGVPFQSKDRIGAENVATVLALASTPLGDAEFSEARAIYGTKIQAREGAQPISQNLER